MSSDSTAESREATARRCVIDERIDDVAIISIDSPPVNSFSHAVRMGVYRALELAVADPKVRVAILLGRGRGFSAGGDIREFGSPAATEWPQLSLDLHAAIEASPKPIVAALHGIAIGGGLETALACHYRIAHEQTAIALPEVGLGLIPLSGTQRLPRLMAIDACVDFILRAERVRACDLGDTPVFDEVFAGPEQDLINIALAFARRVSRHSGSHLLVRDKPIFGPDSLERLRAAQIRWQQQSLSQAQDGALAAIAAAVECNDFDAGMGRARSIYERLRQSPDSRARHDAFLVGR